VPDRRVILEDAETGKELSVPAEEVDLFDDAEAPPPGEV
jgi:hypothetical protein